MKKDYDKISKLSSYQTPETPRAKKKDSDFKTLKESVDKAKKYDDLVKQIKQDRKAFLKELDDYNNQKSFLRVGYKNGYIDGKLALYKTFLDRLNKYLEG